MNNPEHLHILWTNADPHTAQFMLMMYATNSKLRGWWDEVTVIIWGGAACLVAENEMIQEQLKVAQNIGVHFTACVACARQLGVTGQLETLGVALRNWGEPLTELLKSDAKLLTI